MKKGQKYQFCTREFVRMCFTHCISQRFQSPWNLVQAPQDTFGPIADIILKLNKVYKGGFPS